VAIFNRDPAGTNLYQDILIQGNTIRYYGGGTISSQQATFAIATGNLSTNFEHLTVLANSFDRAFPCDLRARNYSFADNTDLSGVALSLRQIEAAAADPIALNPTDEMVQVSGNTSVIVLPWSTASTRKQVIVVNQKLRDRLTVTAQPGERLLPASRAVLGPYQVGRFVANAPGSWTTSK
jgi:hypothetical protein